MFTGSTKLDMIKWNKGYFMSYQSAFVCVKLWKWIISSCKLITTHFVLIHTQTQFNILIGFSYSNPEIMNFAMCGVTVMKLINFSSHRRQIHFVSLPNLVID